MHAPDSKGLVSMANATVLIVDQQLGLLELARRVT